MTPSFVGRGKEEKFCGGRGSANHGAQFGDTGRVRGLLPLRFCHVLAGRKPLNVSDTSRVCAYSIEYYWFIPILLGRYNVPQTFKCKTAKLER